MFPESRENGGPQTTARRTGDWKPRQVEMMKKGRRWAQGWEITRL